jgi:hypothetical protein
MMHKWQALLQCACHSCSLPAIQEEDGDDY